MSSENAAYASSSRAVDPSLAAGDLGVHRETLRLWVRQAEADAGRRSDRLTTAERERLKELEKENRELDPTRPKR